MRTGRKAVAWGTVGVGACAGASGSAPRGFTLIELTISMLIVSILALGMTSALVIANRSVTIGSTPAPGAQSEQLLHDLQPDLVLATTLTELGPTAVEMTVPDRNDPPDGAGETIRYEWSGTPGDPLLRTYNYGATVVAAEDVQQFKVTSRERTIPTDVPPPPAPDPSAWGDFDPAFQATTAVVRAIIGANDDVEESGSLITNDPVLEVGQPGNLCAVLFRNVAIPQGATVSAAYVEFVPDHADSSIANLTIAGEADDDAFQFVPGHAISDRVQTAAVVVWAPSAWGAGAVERTPNIAAIVQEIVSRPGWVSGHRLLIIFNPGLLGSRPAVSYDAAPASAPRLYVEYEVE